VIGENLLRSMADGEYETFLKKIKEKVGVVPCAVIKQRLYFENMLNRVNDQMRKKHPSAPMLYEKYFTECHPFVFIPINLSKGEKHIVEKNTTELDLPYQCICIEMSDGYVTEGENNAGEADLIIYSYIVKEVSPKVYSYFMLAQDHQGREVGLEVTGDDPSQRDAYLSMNDLTNQYLKRLKSEKVGREGSPGKVKINTGVEKIFYKIKPITHVSPKRVISEVRPVAGKEIDWSHRWEVRGHWREISGLGKDREGNYNVKGFTWVSNHVKGPDTAPLIKKTYVVDG
jgi:hypothetical protein